MQPMADRLNHTFQALADPTRRAILARLSSGAASVTELAAPFDMSLPAISKHLKVLERAQLIARGKEAQWRPCELKAAPLQEAADWVEQYRKFWEERFDRLDEYLKELQATERSAAGAVKEEKSASAAPSPKPVVAKRDKASADKKAANKRAAKASSNKNKKNP